MQQRRQRSLPFGSGTCPLRQGAQLRLGFSDPPRATQRIREIQWESEVLGGRRPGSSAQGRDEILIAAHVTQLRQHPQRRAVTRALAQHGLQLALGGIVAVQLHQRRRLRAAHGRRRGAARARGVNLTQCILGPVITHEAGDQVVTRRRVVRCDLQRLAQRLDRFVESTEPMQRTAAGRPGFGIAPILLQQSIRMRERIGMQAEVDAQAREPDPRGTKPARQFERCSELGECAFPLAVGQQDVRVIAAGLGIARIEFDAAADGDQRTRVITAGPAHQREQVPGPGIGRFGCDRAAAVVFGVGEPPLLQRARRLRQMSALSHDGMCPPEIPIV